MHVKFFASRLGTANFNDVRHRLVRIDRSETQLHFVFGDSCEVEQVVNQLRFQLDIATNHRQGCFGFFTLCGLGFEGFHLFAGSQNLRAESICEAQLKSYELALRLAALAPGPVRSLNLGGGFGIPYFAGERRLDLAPIAENLRGLVERARTELPEAALVVELGRYLVGEAGLYVTRIVDRKVSRGHTFLVTDGGLNHHLSASGNFGQVIRKNYPVTIGNRADAAQRELASVVGPLCTPLDLLADRMDLPAAQPGDLVVVFQSGAYGASASPQAFLGHASCVEVLV